MVEIARIIYNYNYADFMSWLNHLIHLHVHCKKCGVTEHPRGAIFYCFHGNPYCYHGNRKILLPWGVQLHRFFYSVYTVTNVVFLNAPGEQYFHVSMVTHTVTMET